MFPLSQPAELITTQDQALLPQDSVQVFPWELCSVKPGSKKLLPKANHLYENPPTVGLSNSGGLRGAQEIK